MAKRPNRPCQEIGCHTLTREIWCDIHKDKAQESSRNYAQYNRGDKVDAFYKSSEWMRLRRLALERDLHMCQRCKRHKILRPAKVVHHLVEVRDDWSKRLVLNNLESLCHFCHNQIHKKGK